MSKYKISVYAICKNESKNIIKWYNSMKEADEIIVLDTGSTDDSINILKKLPKIKLYEEKIIPWRFDTARNKSLSYVSQDTDICVCTDIDEVFEKGWRKDLEESWNSSITRAKYLYNWNFDKYGKPATTFYLDKIHNRNDYTWTHPVHEVLKCLKKENIILLPNVVLNHHQDQNKSRHTYLPLLELSVKEHPNDDRNVHYLGREYMYYEKWDDCIKTLHNHLKLPTATWKDERSASMRYMAFSYYKKGYIEEAIMWYQNAIKEAPYLREPYYDLGNIYYLEKDYINSEYYLKKALKVKEKSLSYINEEKAWNETIYDLLSISCFYNKKYKEAIKYIKKAIKINKANQRLLDNYTYMQKYNI